MSFCAIYISYLLLTTYGYLKSLSDEAALGVVATALCIEIIKQDPKQWIFSAACYDANYLQCVPCVVYLA